MVLAALSLLARTCEIDLSWEREFWSPDEGWVWADSYAVLFLYRFGTWPALLTGGVSALVWAGSKAIYQWQRFRHPSLFLALLLALGPGIVVNAIVKECYRRPRPIQIKEFGGQCQFRPLGEPGGTNESKSFPSGHASMGFYWLGLFIYYWKRRRGLAWGFGGLGLLHGLAMGIGRMAQGGHWFTDVLWSAGFVYLTGWILHYFLCGTGRTGR